MENLSHPLLLAALAALAVGIVASFALGLWQGARREAAAGIDALCAMKWSEFAHLVEDLLRARGLVGSNDERLPGQGGFDLMMTRGSAQYLVVCKNGAAHRVNEQSLRELSSLVDMQGAEGAVLATAGHVDASIAEQARVRRIEILAGRELWRQVKPWVPQDLRQDIESRARGATIRSAVLTAGIALAAGLGVALIAPVPKTSVAPAQAGSGVASPRPPAAVAAVTPTPAPAASGMPVAMPDASLSEKELSTRRATAVLEVRGNPTVQNAQWATRSTLVVVLHQAGVPIPDGLFSEVCRILVQYEELRYTRVQIESPSPEPGGAPGVRWRQCQ
jgi:restriction system protein